MAIVRDNALAKALPDVRCYETLSQQSSASSADLANRLTAVTTERDTLKEVNKLADSVRSAKSTRQANSVCISHAVQDIGLLLKFLKNIDCMVASVVMNPLA